MSQYRYSALSTPRAGKPPEPPTQVVQVIWCEPCHGSGSIRLELPIHHYSNDVEIVHSTCRACNGTGVAAERIVPACAEPFPLARD